MISKIVKNKDVKQILENGLKSDYGFYDLFEDVDMECELFIYPMKVSETIAVDMTFGIETSFDWKFVPTYSVLEISEDAFETPLERCGYQGDFVNYYMRKTSQKFIDPKYIRILRKETVNMAFFVHRRNANYENMAKLNPDFEVIKSKGFNGNLLCRKENAADMKKIVEGQNLIRKMYKSIPAYIKEQLNDQIARMRINVFI